MLLSFYLYFNLVVVVFLLINFNSKLIWDRGVSLGSIVKSITSKANKSIASQTKAAQNHIIM